MKEPYFSKKDMIDILEKVHEVVPIKYAQDVEKVIATLNDSKIISRRTKGRVSKDVPYRTTSRQNDTYSVDEVAELFGVSRAAVYKWIEKNKIKYIAPPIPGGRGYRIPKQQFAGKLVDRQKDDESHEWFVKGAKDIELVTPKELSRFNDEE